MQKGYCSADARPIFFGNGSLYYKLTGANVFEKKAARYLCCAGNLFFWYSDLMFRGKLRFLAFARNGGVLIESFDLS